MARAATAQCGVEVSLGDISVSRLLPVPLSQAEAERQAQKITPALFRVAEEWLK
jgi:hypothetical protein